MKIGTCVYFNGRDGFAEKLDWLKQAGLTGCQLICWMPEIMTEDNAGWLKKLFAEDGLEISAFWCGWDGPKVWNLYEGQTTLGLVPPEYRAMRIENLKRGSDFAAWLGVTDVVTHMGFIPENPYDPQFLPFCDAVREVAEYCAEKGQFLLFETGQETPVTMLRCFETVGTDNLGVNLDTANVILYGKANPVDALDVFGRFVRGIHAKDGLYPVNGHDLGREVKIGEGKVDFATLFTKLKELRYDGYITIEREIDGEQQRRDILDTVGYLKARMEA